MPFIDPEVLDTAITSAILQTFPGTVVDEDMPCADAARTAIGGRMAGPDSILYGARGSAFTAGFELALGLVAVVAPDALRVRPKQIRSAFESANGWLKEAAEQDTDEWRAEDRAWWRKHKRKQLRAAS
jgi:hypothetical protein